jgi:hypothetical protein
MMGRRGNGEGSIYQRKDGRWVGQYMVYTAKVPKYRYLYGKTRQAVAEKLTKAMAERDGGLVFEEGKLTVAEYMDKWLTNSAHNRLRPKTYKDYAGLTRVHIIPALGHIKLKNLTPLLVLTPVGGRTRVSDVNADEGSPHNAGSNTTLPARVQTRSRPPCPLLAE